MTFELKDTHRPHYMYAERIYRHQQYWQGTSRERYLILSERSLRLLNNVSSHGKHPFLGGEYYMSIKA